MSKNQTSLSPSALQVIRRIEHHDPALQSVVKRLHEMGLYVDLEIEIIRTVSFGGVTVIRFHQSLLALNTEEMSCLKF